MKFLHEDLMSRFDFNVFDDLQFGCCISCNFCPIRMNSFFFRVFRLKEAETTNMTTGHNIHDTLLGWLGEKNA